MDFVAEVQFKKKMLAITYNNVSLILQYLSIHESGKIQMVGHANNASGINTKILMVSLVLSSF